MKWLLVLAACSAHGTAQPDAALVPPQGCDALDSDGDGWSDAVETAMGTSPTDPNDNPDTRHEIVFAVPFQGAPRPTSHDVTAAARLARADVAIVLDTSGSMLGTDTRIQAQFQLLVTMLAGQIDDLAFGAAGMGDFPIQDNANSEYDVPYYLVHRIMTARTKAGLDSIVKTFVYKNIITDGLGPWFAGMRGGDDPEQGWEALRQTATGIGITYPSPLTGTGSVPPFSTSTAYPTTIPAGEEAGTLGGMGFRQDSLPILILISDTTQHDIVLTTTTPPSADFATATAALAQIGAIVIGLNTWTSTGDADMQRIANATGARVTPDAWGSGAARPANCPVGRCCLIADDPSVGGTATQPLPVNGECTLAFWSDRYDDNLAQMMAQAITAIARGVKFAGGAKLVDDPSDAVDALVFVDHVEAIAEGACAGAAVHDSDGDGVPDTFDVVAPGGDLCFRIQVKINATVATTGKYHAQLQLTRNGVAALAPVDVWFVVPDPACNPPVIGR
jgi:hypothetical protein